MVIIQLLAESDSKTTYLDEAEQYYHETFTKQTRMEFDNINVTKTN